MATKIFYNDNRIIIDGHADTPTECQAITAMCDSLANDENFKTIVYEKGHAVFERIGGGEKMMFDISKYVLTSRYNDETGYDATELAMNGTIKQRLDDIENDYLAGYESSTLLARVIGYGDGVNYTHNVQSHLSVYGTINSRLQALENRLTKVLPYTADEFTTLLAKLENLE